MKNILPAICYTLLLLIAGCHLHGNQSHGHDHGSNHSAHAHDGEDEHSNHSMSKTLWSDQSELFVEFHPLVAGFTSTFVTHLTNVKDYKPYKQGKLSVSLIKGKKGIRQTIDTPSAPGIFTLSLLPKEAGNYTLIFDFITEEISERFSIPNVTVYADEAAALEAETKPEDSNRVLFTKEQTWRIDFSTQRIEKRPFRNVVKTTGELISSSKDRIKLVAQTSGIVHFSSNKIVQGKTVVPREVLFHISGQGVSDNNLTTRYIDAKSNYEKEKSNFTRAQKLRSEKIVSEKAYLETKLAYEKAEAKFQLISHDYSLKGVKTVAPRKGFISNIAISEGEFVEKGQLLAIIDHNEKLVLRADLYQNELHRIDDIHSANFKPAYSNKIYNTKSLNGKVIAYGKDIQKSDYTTPVFFEVNKASGLYSGAFTEVYLEFETRKNVIAVPKSAILEDQGMHYVFIQDGGESFSKSFVKTGADNGTEIQIMEGINAGDRIVTNGAYFIHLASLNKNMPAHSHSH